LPCSLCSPLTLHRILQATDPGSFASLVLLNSKWHRVSQQADLYARQLSRCTAYAGRTPASILAKAAKPPYPLEHDDEQQHEHHSEEDVRLPRLRMWFAHETKRGLFAAYLRPTETTVRLVSNSISSSSAPGGEGMQFSASPRGHHLLAYNSSRIYVLDMRGPAEDVVRRELGILRRPASTCITDDGTLLAVLSTEMQVDVYDLEQSPPRRRQSLILDHRPRAIALSPCGSVIAAAYEGGIEVSSVAPNALPTERRAVKCDAVDALAFSFDGTQLLGTTTSASASPNTVILTAPYYDPGSLLEENNIGPLWTTSILFPNTSRDCSHAVLLQYSVQEEASWTIAYDRSLETFRAVRVDDLRNGTTYFTGPIAPATSQAKLLPCTLPAASYRGELVSAGFQGKDIWVYGVPEDLDAMPEAAATTDAGSSSGGTGPGRRHSVLSQRSSSHLYDSSGERVPKWQVLRNKSRNNFISGSKVAELDGVSHVKWVCGFGNGSTQERLVIAARGIIPGKLVTDEEDIDFVDGGRVTLLDFDYTIRDGGKREMTIEVGTQEAETLEEEQRDMETEVAIVRRRTVAQKRGDRTTLLRAATTTAAAGARRANLDDAATATPAGSSSSSSSSTFLLVPPLPGQVAELDDNNNDDDPLVPRRIGQAPRRGADAHSIPVPPIPASPTIISIEADTSSLVDEQEALDMPYSHGNPRSGPTLRRAATAAAANRQRQPEMPVAGQVEYRRADGRREHPHESDADNWVPPPPPYQKDAPAQDLPAFMRQPAVGPGGVVIDPNNPFSGMGMFGAVQSPAGPSGQATHGHEIQRPVTQPVVPSSPYHAHYAQVASPSPRSPSVTSSMGWGDHPRRHRRSVSMSDSRPASGHRPVSGHSSSRYHEFNELYDVSPPDSPRAYLRHSSYVSPRAAVASTVNNNAQSPPQQHRVAPHVAPQPATATMSPRQQPLPPLPVDASERIRLAAEHAPQPVYTPQLHHPLPQAPYTQPMVSQPWSPAQEPYVPPQPSRGPTIQTNVYTPPLPLLVPGTAHSHHHHHHYGPHSAVEPRQYAVPAWSAQQPHQPTLVDGRPRTEVYYNPPGPTTSVPDLPPLPRPDQLASLQRQLAQGNNHSHHLSRDRDLPHLPESLGLPQPIYTPNHHLLQQRPMTADHVTARSTPPHPPPDMPLIISTPSGVTGALDNPTARRPSFVAPQASIFAPVPRRSTPHSLDIRPTVERLEGIYHSNHSNHTTPNLHDPSTPVPSSPLSGMRRRPRSRYRSGLFNILSGGGSESPPPPMPSMPPMPGQELRPQPSSDGSLVGRRKSLMLRRTRKKKKTTIQEDVPAVPALPALAEQQQQQNPLWAEEQQAAAAATSRDKDKDKGKGSKCVVM
jgi:hypothetical protein